MVEDECFLFCCCSRTFPIWVNSLRCASAVLVQNTNIECIQQGFLINESFGIEYEYFHWFTVDDARIRNSSARYFFFVAIQIWQVSFLGIFHVVLQHIACCNLINLSTSLTSNSAVRRKQRSSSREFILRFRMKSISIVQVKSLI